MLDALLNHPAVKKARAAGEERVGKAVSHLLANPRFMDGVQSLVTTALQARATLENGLKRTLQAVNLPTSADLEALRRKLDELEALVDDLAERTRRDAPPPSEDQKH
jgi:hypothetical protein